MLYAFLVFFNFVVSRSKIVVLNIQIFEMALSFNHFGKFNLISVDVNLIQGLLTYLFFPFSYNFPDLVSISHVLLVIYSLLSNELIFNPCILLLSHINLINYLCRVLLGYFHAYSLVSVTDFVISLIFESNFSIHLVAHLHFVSSFLFSKPFFLFNLHVVEFSHLDFAISI